MRVLLIVVVVLLSISSAVAFSSARVTKLQKLANPAPPPKVEAFRPKMMPEGVKFSQDSELEQAKRSTKKIYQEIPTNKVKVVPSKDLTSAINVISRHDTEMTKLHGLTTDVEYLKN